MTQAEIQELFDEASCFACFGASQTDLLKLALLARAASGCFQCSSGAGAPVAAPSVTTQPAQYRDTTSGFNYRWDVQSQGWEAIPRVYRALLTQAGTAAPVATVLENTLSGSPVWTRTGVGTYRMTLASSFPSGKTLRFVGEDAASDAYVGQTSLSGGGNAIDLFVKETTSGSTGDELLNAASMTVLVYP